MQVFRPAVACFLLVGVSDSTILAQTDSPQQRLDAAIVAYNTTVERTTSTLSDYLSGKIADARRRGDLDLIRSLESAQGSIQQGALPSLPLVSGRVEQAKRDLSRAKRKLETEFEEVKRQYVRQGNDDVAEAVRDEWQELDRRTPEGSVVATKRKPRKAIPADAVQWPPGVGHHYKLFTDPNKPSWTEAQERCREMGGYLACGEQKEELDFLFELKGRSMVWLGATRRPDGSWWWTTGGKAPHATDWKEGRDFMASTQQTASSARIARADDSRWANGFICEWE
jgi:hypothetical protein